MLQFTPASSLPASIIPASIIPGGPDAAAASDPVLDFAGPIAGTHALVISRSGLDLMCRLLRHRCAAVTTVQPGERCGHDAYELVLVSSGVSTATASLLVQQAKRALLPGGRFLAVVPVLSTMTNPSAPAMLARLLKANGFIRVQTRATPDGVLVGADLPIRDAHEPPAAPQAQA